MSSPTPDWEAIKDKRMCDLTPAQQEDARELWLREQVGWMGEYHRPHYEFLLRRLDEARAAALTSAAANDTREALAAKCKLLANFHEKPALRALLLAAIDELAALTEQPAAHELEASLAALPKASVNADGEIFVNGRDHHDWNDPLVPLSAVRAMLAAAPAAPVQHEPQQPTLWTMLTPDAFDVSRDDTSKEQP